MKSLAPIALFVYNRPNHTKKTIDALKQNKLASQSELYVYADASRKHSEQSNVDQVRLLISQIEGFKKVTIIEQDTNIGLAKSIVSGVSDIVNKHGRVIVLEDDLVTSPVFLTFMNRALEFYIDKKNVWHISGWNYPLEQSGLGSTFLWRAMNCWGWATWSDRWTHFEKNAEQLIGTFTKDDIRQFNLNNCENFWDQVLANKAGKIDTWAIFWYATIFQNNGLCLNPTVSYVTNIGLDGSGVHCGVNDAYGSQLNDDTYYRFDIDLYEDKLALSRIQKFYRNMKKPFIIRFVNKFFRIMFNGSITK